MLFTLLFSESFHSFSSPMKIGAVIAHQKQASPQRHRAWAALGCQSFAYAFRYDLDGIDLPRLADEARAASAETHTIISAVGLYGNTLADSAAGEAVRLGLVSLIKNAAAFGTDLVSCFAGRVDGLSVPESLPRLIEVFTPLIHLAEDHGVRLALENCRQGGTWLSGAHNCAFHPQAWEMIFDRLPSPTLGLEWDPAHLVAQQLDPIETLSHWASRIYHVHAKDAMLDHAILQRHGLHGPESPYPHVNPGRGLTDWAAVFSLLKKHGYTGTIDLELGYDPLYRDDQLEAGLLFSLDHLRKSRSSF
jgi:sugar phosphate isomerase/epimerase